MSTAALHLPSHPPGDRPSHRPDHPRFAAGACAPRRPAGLIAIAAAHVAVLWLFLQGDVVSRAVHQVSPLMVALLSDPAPPRLPDPALPAPARQARPLPAPALLPPPEVRLADAPAAPPPAPVVASVVLPQAPATPAASPPAPADPAPVRAVPAQPPAPPVLNASAIRYRVPPAIEVPLASRRLRESGTVLLRVLVDTQGLPRQVSLHRSSGFARLDEQALAAMRQARFQTVNDGGNAIEWVVIAPLQYDVD
jgi:protein TonB